MSGTNNAGSADAEAGDYAQNDHVLVAENIAAIRRHSFRDAGVDLDVDAIDENGDTKLFWAVVEGRTGYVKPLVAAGASIEAGDKESNTALILAAIYGHIKCVKFLLSFGADKEARNKDGNTALISAASWGHTACVKALLDAGVRRDVGDNQGHTALMGAAIFNKIDCAKLLIEAGADEKAKNKAGYTAFALAVNDHKDCADAICRAVTKRFLESFPRTKDIIEEFRSNIKNREVESVSYLFERCLERVFEGENFLSDLAVACAVHSKRKGSCLCFSKPSNALVNSIIEICRSEGISDKHKCKQISEALIENKAGIKNVINMFAKLFSAYLTPKNLDNLKAATNNAAITSFAPVGGVGAGGAGAPVGGVGAVAAKKYVLAAYDG